MARCMIETPKRHSQHQQTRVFTTNARHWCSSALRRATSADGRIEGTPRNLTRCVARPLMFPYHPVSVVFLRLLVLEASQGCQGPAQRARVCLLAARSPPRTSTSPPPLVSDCMRFTQVYKFTKPVPFHQWKKEDAPSDTWRRAKCPRDGVLEQMSITSVGNIDGARSGDLTAVLIGPRRGHRSYTARIHLHALSPQRRKTRR